MKLKRISRILAVVVALSMMPVVSVSAQEDRTISCVSDSYTSSLNSTTNYGTEKELLISADDEDVKKAYLNFNIGSLPEDEDMHIFLRLTPVRVEIGTDMDENEESTVTLWGLKSHDWKQSTITASKVPVAGTAVSALKLEENQLCQVDVTDYVKANVSDKGYVSFMISEDNDTGSIYSIASKEADTGKPELFIDMDYVAPPVEEVEITPSTPDSSIDYNEYYASGEGAKVVEEIIGDRKPVEKVDNIEYPDLSGIPDDVYIEDFTTSRVNKHLVNYLYTDVKNIESMMKGRDEAQVSYSLAISQQNPNLILLGSDCLTLHRSDDGGKTFYNVSEGLAGNGINDLIFHPDDDSIAFALVTYNGEAALNSGRWQHVGIYKSTDSGKTWTHKPSGIQAKLNGTFIKYFAFGGEQEDGIRPLYVSATNGIWRSMDLGETWECIYEGAFSRHVKAFGNTVMFSGGMEGLKISYDLGETWEDKTGSLKGKFIASTDIDPANEKHWVCAVDNESSGLSKNNALYHSWDGGETWSLLIDRKGMKINTLAGIVFGPVDPDTGKARLYMASRMNQYAIRYSDDGGKTWILPFYDSSDRYEQITGGYWCAKLAFCEAFPKMVITSYPNISFSYNKGTDFYPRCFNRCGNRTMVMSVDPRNSSSIIFGHIDVGPTTTLPLSEGEWYPLVYRASDGGRKGTPQLRSIWGLARDPEDDDRLLFIHGNWTGIHTMIETTDNGLNWIPYETNETFEPTQRMFWHKQQTNVVYCGTRKSTDSGKTWEILEHPVRAMSPTNGDIVYTNVGKAVYISEDQGKTWSEFSETDLAGLDGSKTIVVDIENPYRIYVGAAGVGMFIVDEGTVTRKNHADGVLNSPIGNYGNTIEGIAQNPKNPDHIIVGGRDLSKISEPSAGIFESFDRGETFVRTIEIPAPADIFWVEFHPEYPIVYIGTSGGNYVYEYENYDKQRPESYYTDTEGTFCEEEVKYLVDSKIIGEEAYKDYYRAFEMGIDRYVYEGDFLTLMLETEDFIALSQDANFEDVNTEHRFYAQVQIGLENGLVLKTDGEDGKLNLLWKKLTQGMCAKYLVRLMSLNGINTTVTVDEIEKYKTDAIDYDTANALAVLYKYSVLTGNDGFEVSGEKEITRGEMAYMFARTLKLYK